MTTPAVWIKELIEAFVESTTAPGSLFKTSMGWSLLLPTCIMTEEAGTALHLHSMKKIRSETANRSTRWQLGRAVEDDETFRHIICSFAWLWKVTTSAVTVEFLLLKLVNTKLRCILKFTLIRQCRTLLRALLRVWLCFKHPPSDLFEWNVENQQR